MTSKRTGLNSRVVFKSLSVIVLLVLGLVSIPIGAAAEEGMATWYGEPFHGRVMYGGQVFDMYDPSTTAANIFPIGTWLKVTNPRNGKSVVVQVRDRGGFSHAVDLSFAAFQTIEDPNKMMIRVTYEVVTGPDGTPKAPAPAPTPNAPVASPAQSAAPTGGSAPKAVDVKPPVPTPNDYTVAKGDTLNSIARRFGLDASSLVKLNALGDPNRISIGQRLLLITPPSVAAPTPSSRGVEASTNALADTTTHTVAPGDTIWVLATKYGVTRERLAELNGLSDPNTIVIGQRLAVSDAKDPPASNMKQAGATGQYVVQAGDTLFSIASEAGTTPEELADINNIADPNLIQIGQTLTLP